MIARIALMMLIFSLCFQLGAQEAAPLDDGSTEAPSGQDVESVVEQWRQTLQFGIDSEVANLLPQLRENSVRQLAPEVMEVMSLTLNTEVKIESLRYLTDLEVIAALPAVVEILRDSHLSTSTELLQHALGYVDAVVAERHGENSDSDVPDDEDTQGMLDEVTAVVRDLVGHRDSRLSSTAVRTLGAMGDAETVALLMDLYAAPRTPIEVRHAVILSFGDLGAREAEDLLLSIAQDITADETSRYYAIDSLSRIGSEDALPVLTALLGSPDAILRSYVVSALARYPDPELVSTLLSALRDSFWRVRVSALQGIAERKAAEAVPAVKYKIERDPEMRVRYEAVKALASIDTEDGWEFLRGLYADQRVPPTVRNSIADVLIEHNLSESREVIATVVQQEWDRDGSQLLDFAAKRLSQTEAPDLEGFYAKLLTHPNFIIRIYGLRGITLNGSEGFRQELTEIVENEHAHPALRSNAAAALQATEDAEEDHTASE